MICHRWKARTLTPITPIPIRPSPANLESSVFSRSLVPCPVVGKLSLLECLSYFRCCGVLAAVAMPIATMHENHGLIFRKHQIRLPDEGQSPKSGHRMAAERLHFPWRWNGGTIFQNLDVIRGISTKWSSRKSRFRRAGGDPNLVAVNNLHPSGKVYTPWADPIIPLAELALLKEEPS